MLTVLIGASGSGKSAIAQSAISGQAQVTYLATGLLGSSVDEFRLAKHRSSRPSHWSVIEEPKALQNALQSIHDVPILLDDVNSWLVNSRPELDEIEAVIFALAVRKSSTVVVSCDPDSAFAGSSEEVVNLLRFANNCLSAAAKNCFWVAAGRVVELRKADPFVFQEL
ncbi:MULTISPECIES: bifunctional adenosylcobinamide kinase/adenosylcobinamide-phosphate guanylyltransferase [unclassified Microbacterium]|uniref:bifunctional adenosylcobinamide kinase/adenosylcobinamide-phosphate guanylyltransferase n=1 Tax=unclassified Microbacterium TaxID=2609290 RepID=UPI000CFCEB8A|nr:MULTISPECIES: bifunctional adenosylcobinamide kinase/adenosylcobinamide-phosphate guanylyltransferase [unclassified Microbacterium]PQZ53033.1 hypothetical protein CQ032_16295 [Microbacterium sp. MYb43]PQZ73261.1 hypothetical protein CQ031_17650 [Microbacterium sp. MYb40]PRB18719.1 hypothetical protein CQ040_16725 [Microbacterium sp. MYb54]PRB24388.1 hypothetical protein CQ037_17070 [Microbacterium sp. MYb50]PRB64436.1 hypothetical protein CQ027_20020 [Microbacterium sp. MYb32]